LNIAPNEQQYTEPQMRYNTPFEISFNILGQNV